MDNWTNDNFIHITISFINSDVIVNYTKIKNQKLKIWIRSGHFYRLLASGPWMGLFLQSENWRNYCSVFHNVNSLSLIGYMHKSLWTNFMAIRCRFFELIGGPLCSQHPLSLLSQFFFWLGVEISRFNYISLYQRWSS